MLYSIDETKTQYQICYCRKNPSNYSPHRWLCDKWDCPIHGMQHRNYQYHFFTKQIDATKQWYTFVVHLNHKCLATEIGHYVKCLRYAINKIRKGCQSTFFVHYNYDGWHIHCLFSKKEGLLSDEEFSSICASAKIEANTKIIEAKISGWSSVIAPHSYLGYLVRNLRQLNLDELPPASGRYRFVYGLKQRRKVVYGKSPTSSSREASGGIKTHSEGIVAGSGAAVVGLAFQFPLKQLVTSKPGFILHAEHLADRGVVQPKPDGNLPFGPSQLDTFKEVLPHLDDFLAKPTRRTSSLDPLLALSQSFFLCRCFAVHRSLPIDIAFVLRHQSQDAELELTRWAGQVNLLGAGEELRLGFLACLGKFKSGNGTADDPITTVSEDGIHPLCLDLTQRPQEALACAGPSCHLFRDDPHTRACPGSDRLPASR